MLPQIGQLTLNGLCASTIQAGLPFGSASDVPHLGHLLLAETAKARGTTAEGVRSASLASSQAAHSSAILMYALAVSRAEGNFAIFWRAVRISSSVNSVRR